MSAFERLHPAIQHHVVNSLEWRRLRPLQERAIPPLLDGKSALLLAPTAGGKTEAAIFPILSRMLVEDWRGLSVIYLCPIRALLNNLEVRLSRFGGLVGRRCALWHGDIGDSDRKRIIADPPDILLTTPESLEVILTARQEIGKGLLANLQVVIVDEIHAFAGDDRGWHLLAVLERVERLVPRQLQRVGLSATVGNPKELLDWLDAARGVERAVIDPGPGPRTDVDVQLDFVGNLANAAKVIASLHRGEKRLVFCDSRARVERLASFLREREVATFVSHGSLGIDERRRAEAAFASGTDCVIVATSTLELGIDVGDLDRMIQIDAPGTVSSFLQRLGRTGRRQGTTRNGLFLATSDDALLRAAGLLALWETGFVEPLRPPAFPFHLAAQQLLALVLQERGITRADWARWSGRFLAAAGIAADDAAALVEQMLGQGILSENDGILWVGDEGERLFGRRNFLELFSSFSAPPQFTVLHGRDELGLVDPLSFVSPSGHAPVLLLGGRSWEVKQLDWNKRLAWVHPSKERGTSRWSGAGVPLHRPFCQAIRTLLISTEEKPYWSVRAKTRLEELRREFSWVDPHKTTLVPNPDGTTDWWTFAGLRANSTLAQILTGPFVAEAIPDNLRIRFKDRVLPDELASALSRADRVGAQLSKAMLEEAGKALKFEECLPEGLKAKQLAARLLDPEGARKVGEEGVGFWVRGE